jgi:AAA+ ATPase superfamily predicted ATPase
MEKAVLAERSPLFGRRTAQRRLEPLRPADTLAFFPAWSVKDRVLAYAILGGMPAYLQRFDSRRSLRENLLAEVLRPEGYLFDEVNFLLRSELSNPATYASILAACARGAERLNDIALEAGLDSTTAGKYLHVLRELRLIEREIPLSDPNPLRSRRGAYRVADRFVSFHFRHVQSQLSLIHAGRGNRVLEQHVEPDLVRLFDEARVDFILDHLRTQAAELFGEEMTEVGRFGGEFVRALARTAEGRTVAAVVIPDGRRSTAALEREERELELLFGVAPWKLVYGIGADPERPLEVERVPDGEIL